MIIHDENETPSHQEEPEATDLRKARAVQPPYQQMNPPSVIQAKDHGSSQHIQEAQPAIRKEESLVSTP